MIFPSLLHTNISLDWRINRRGALNKTTHMNRTHYLTPECVPSVLQMGLCRSRPYTQKHTYKNEEKNMITGEVR